MSVFKAEGLTGVLSAIGRRIRTPRARCYPVCREIVSGASGLEIGGPSPIFARAGLLPLYRRASRIDNCNFAQRTIWEGAITEGDSFSFDSRKAAGRQFIAEGADLRMVPSGTYDFVLSSHMLEHTANPLRALSEWGRVLKPGGGLVLVVPHRDGTFDHRRPITAMQHLIADFERGTGEDDLTHLPEVLTLHDVSKDPGARGINFQERAERNGELRTIHHHVFDTRLVVAAVTTTGLEVEAVELLRPYHVVVLARKARDGTGGGPLSEDALRLVLRRSPFRTDREAS
ncbi:MAG TPA: class I SAM-dependent methyltransferase [Nitrospirales bacterium]|nr:class I SAM-dependent methyltransferase [Nitrospirales bacterium]